MSTEMLSPEPLRSAKLQSALAPSSGVLHFESTCPHAGSFTTSLRRPGREGREAAEARGAG